MRQNRDPGQSVRLLPVAENGAKHEAQSNNPGTARRSKGAHCSQAAQQGCPMTQQYRNSTEPQHKRATHHDDSSKQATGRMQALTGGAHAVARAGADEIDRRVQRIGAAHARLSAAGNAIARQRALSTKRSRKQAKRKQKLSLWITCCLQRCSIQFGTETIVWGR